MRYTAAKPAGHSRPAGYFFPEGVAMIVRVLHEGQYEIEGQALEQVNQLDDQMFRAVTENDASRYHRLFDEALGLIRQQGKELAIEDLRSSELILPAPDATMKEVHDLFVQEGLITG
jgi:hypothetical protein